MISSQLVFWFALAAIVSTSVSIAVLLLSSPGKYPPWFPYFLFHIGAYTLWLFVHSFLFFNLVLMDSASPAVAIGGEMFHLLVSIIIMFTYPPFIYKITGIRESARIRLFNIAVPGIILVFLLVSFVIRSFVLLFFVNVIFNSCLLGFSIFGYIKLRLSEAAGLRAAMKNFLGIAVVLYVFLVLSALLVFIIPAEWFADIGLLFTALFCAVWSLLMIRERISSGAGRRDRNMVSDSFIRDYRISPREQEVLEKLIQGKTQRIIGDELFISTRTVEAHVHKIYRKAGVGNRMDLLLALQNT